jgi:uncharacterized protein with von Willebrand factor type A (vWA) domain
MLIEFFLKLKQAGIPVSIKEFLTLMDALKHGIAYGSIDDFYYLGRLTLVKDETHFDKYDRVFAEYFKGAIAVPEDVAATIPEEWLRKLVERFLADEEKAQIEALGGLDKVLELLKRRIAEQDSRHEGGAKWIGTAGTSPFGAHGFNPEGVRIGQENSRHRSAIKVWDRRDYRNYDDTVELGVRNIKVALRKLRHFAREGAPEELDLSGTIHATANNAGYLDIKLVPELHNKIKVLLFLDVGGSMDDHIKVCEELFSAARAEFKYLEYFYFHNFVYESVWRNNHRRQSERFQIWDIIHKYGADYKLVFVGDATMSPYEITEIGGSIEHMNEEPGSTWVKRLIEHYKNAIWLNPVREEYWDYTSSVKITRQLIGERMFPLTLDGLERGIKLLRRRLG